jgi:hypothetical protein
MVFLIEYDRSSGTLVQFKEFDESQRDVARRTRLDLELRLNREGSDHEVVILEASNEEALRISHARYFKDLSELVRTSPALKLQPGEGGSLVFHDGERDKHMYHLRPGEAAVLIVRRSDTEPRRYFIAIRKSSSSFDPATHDFQLDGLQEALLELGEPSDFERALDTAFDEIRNIRP